MKKKTWLPVLLVLLAALLGAALWMNGREETPVENAGQAVHAPQAQTSLNYRGEEYPLKEGLQTVLLIGTDGTERYEKQEDLLQDYYNYSQADFLMLLALDTEAGAVEIIQVNRDTMMDVPWLDVIGNYGGTEFQQICLAFNSGDGGRASCLNTVDAVSDLLFDMPIQHYIQMPMSAIPALNNLVGGVPVVIPEDLTRVDPMFRAGATVHLTGEQAEKFVRARMILENDSNVARMSRQRIYLDSFQVQARKAVDTDSDFVLKLVEKAGEFIQSDLTAQQLSDLVVFLDQAKVSPIRTADGELLVGKAHYEFFVEEASLWEIVKRACCQ